MGHVPHACSRLILKGEKYRKFRGNFQVAILFLATDLTSTCVLSNHSFAILPMEIKQKWMEENGTCEKKERTKCVDLNDLV